MTVGVMNPPINGPSDYPSVHYPLSTRGEVTSEDVPSDLLEGLSEIKSL